WPAASVDARIAPVPLVDADGNLVLDSKGRPVTVLASTWLDQNQPVEQITWAPGEPKLIKDKLVADGGWIKRSGCAVFNLYRPPTIIRGNAIAAKRWLDHFHRIYPDDADRAITWLAHRVQHPEVKINHALVLGGGQGIGKDTLIEPVRRAVGPW